jgi:hypothetical protein
MRRVLVVFAACAIGSFVLAGSAQAAGGAGAGGGGAAGARPAMKKGPKAKRFEWCGSTSGCGFVYDFYPKTKTWAEETGPEYGSYVTGPKGLLVMTTEWEGYGCRTELHKVKHTKNYAGSETNPHGNAYCYTQEVYLTFL